MFEPLSELTWPKLVPATSDPTRPTSHRGPHQHPRASRNGATLGLTLRVSQADSGCVCDINTPAEDRHGTDTQATELCFKPRTHDYDAQPVQSQGSIATVAWARTIEVQAGHLVAKQNAFERLRFPFTPCPALKHTSPPALRNAPRYLAKAATRARAQAAALPTGRHSRPEKARPSGPKEPTAGGNAQGWRSNATEDGTDRWQRTHNDRPGPSGQRTKELPTNPQREVSGGTVAHKPRQRLADGTVSKRQSHTNGAGRRWTPRRVRAPSAGRNVNTPALAS